MQQISTRTKQTATDILMVRPANFGFNPETADNNSFQEDDGSLSREQIREKAIQEFDQFTARLIEAGMHVIIWQDQSRPLKTDAVFPNNWVSFHEDGTLITYPMFSHNRRQERRAEMLNHLGADYRIRRRIKLEHWEEQEKFLESTGSLVLDRPNGIAYACLSVRTDEDLVDEFCRLMHYQKCVFRSVDRGGEPVYHTNVMMAVGEGFVVICLESVPDPNEQQMLRERFAHTRKEVIEISLDQMYAFAGNMIQVKNQAGAPFLVMSSQAYRSLNPEQIARLQAHTSILHSELSTIETYGGGSARCMIAEVFLPRLRTI